MEHRSGGPARLQKSSDRRATARFPLTLEVRYAIAESRRPKEVGSGQTIDLSSSGLCFLADKQLQTGLALELYIDWPVLLDGGVQLQLVMAGHVVRTRGLTTALKIERHEFRTRKGGGKVSGPIEFPG